RRLFEGVAAEEAVAELAAVADHGEVAARLAVEAGGEVAGGAVILQALAPARLEDAMLGTAARAGLVALDVAAHGFLIPLTGRPVGIQAHDPSPRLTLRREAYGYDEISTFFGPARPGTLLLFFAAATLPEDVPAGEAVPCAGASAISSCCRRSCCCW